MRNAVGLKEYIESILEERDRLYDARFKASETAVSAAFAASEKALNKRETEAQGHTQQTNWSIGLLVAIGLSIFSTVIAIGTALVIRFSSH